MPDMSGTFRREAEAAVKRAKALQAAGDVASARGAYLRASELTLKYARTAPTAAIKKQRLDRANALKAQAGAVAGPRVRSGAAGPPGPDDDESPSADREQAARLVARSDVTWDDIAGLEGVKAALRTAYVMAMAVHPEGTTLDAPREVLLYGPPGTGKTLLAQAVSNSLDATFFSIRTGDLLSSLFGKSPQLIASLFAEAADRAPSVVFFDELDSLTPSRDREISGAESRVLTAFLQSLGGFSTKPDQPFVLTIGATNAPWQLDSALLSRFGSKIYVPLPDAACREGILRLNIDNKGIRSELDAPTLAEITDGYSGRGIWKLCQQAIRAAVGEQNPDLADVAGRTREEVATHQLKLERVASRHFREAMTRVKPETDEVALAKFAQWARQHGG